MALSSSDGTVRACPMSSTTRGVIRRPRRRGHRGSTATTPARTSTIQGHSRLALFLVVLSTYVVLGSPSGGRKEQQDKRGQQE